MQAMQAMQARSEQSKRNQVEQAMREKESIKGYSFGNVAAKVLGFVLLSFVHLIIRVLVGKKKGNLAFFEKNNKRKKGNKVFFFVKFCFRKE